MNQKISATPRSAPFSKVARIARLCSGIVAQPDQTQRRSSGLRRAVGLAGLLLLAATWQLWTPQSVYPQVPLVGLFRAAPAWLQWAVLAGQVVCLLLATVLSNKSQRWHAALAGFAGFTLLAALIDQHRLQPWAYQLAVMGIVLAWCPAPRAIVLLRVLTISIYFYSAISKFDFVFLHTVGQQLIGALLEFVHLGGDELWHSTRWALALLLPIGELLVAGGLCLKRTRTAALVASLTMHVMLFLAVGPWGLSHKPGVLVWNLFFIVQNLLLFTDRWPRLLGGEARCGSAAPAAGCARRHFPQWGFAQWLILAVVVLPILEPWGRFDHWLAWGLYAPKAGRALTYVHRSAGDRLAEPLRRHLQEEDPDSPWLRLRLEDWSLAELDVPIYPQDRFQLGVAEAVGRRYGLNRLLRVALLTPADRFTGERAATTLEGVQALTAAGGNYLFNTHPGLLYLQDRSSGGQHGLHNLSPTQGKID